MGDPPPFDPCECIFSPAGAMRRLISLLRNSQSHCTDEQCFPTTTQGLGNRDDSGVFLMYAAIAWIVLAFVLYMFRPQNLRDTDGKPSRSDNGPRDPPPAPPVM